MPFWRCGLVSVALIYSSIPVCSLLVPVQSNFMRLLIALFLILLLSSFAGCRKARGPATAPSGKEQPKIEACALITNDEIQQIQGAPVKDTKPSENSDGRFRIAQCFYTTNPFNKSVSLAVTQSDATSANAGNPKDFWKETFGRYEGETEEHQGDEERKEGLHEQDEKKPVAPKKIEGLGEAAFWTANRMGGALYVLKNNVFIRISIGGSDKEEVRIDRSKALARKALSRL